MTDTLTRSRLRGLLWKAMATVFAASLLLALSACGRDRDATPTPVATGSSVAEPDLRPDNNASGVIRPDKGGTIGLRDGAQVTIPPNAVSDITVVTLRAVTDPPDAAIPHSIVGRAYEFSLEGGGLTGVALVRLPLLADAEPDQYELAAYRWKGKMWERITGRFTGQAIQFGTNTPGLFAVQGRWRHAEATLTISMGQSRAGQQMIPVSVAGDYRYTALPLLQHEFVPARIKLKRDSSGGAGQVTGIESLDQTVAETVLWFKPNPEQPEGVIEFSHVFEIQPGQLDVSPGTTSRFYAVLTVEDSAAPTRQASTGIEYTQMLPIQIIGTDVVRPQRVNEEAQPLRWNVEVNDVPLFQEPASGLTLSLNDVLARGGLGNYRITLEAQFEGEWVTASNPVTVQLRLPATATPLPTATLLPSPIPLATPTPERGVGAPTPTMPATPTRRTPPGRLPTEPTEAPSPTGTSAATATALPTATRPAWASVYWADSYRLSPGQCTMLHWNVENVSEVYFEGNATTGNEDRQVCPTQTTTYSLRTVNSEGSQTRSVTISVAEQGEPAVVFSADSYEIAKGSCTMLHWRAVDVAAVYLNGEGVAGEASLEICPEATTTYELRVVNLDGASTTTSRTIIVTEADKIVMHFWAEQYTMNPGDCTTIHWSVQDVDAVYLTTDVREGVAGTGSRQACPDGNRFYVLEAEAGDRAATKTITLTGATPSLDTNEVIAQGLVNSTTRIADVDPALSGDQPGWEILVDGLNALFSGSSGCCTTVATLQFAESLTEAATGQVDWPINPGQLVEFRAVCQDGLCTLSPYSPQYLRLRSD